MGITFELLEGRIFGARYYTAEPKMGWESGWYHQDWNDMQSWCVKTFGPTPIDGIWTPGSNWYVNNAKFWFRKEEDRAVFLLRWA